MKCPKCNNEISEKVKFCPDCGALIEGVGKTCPNTKCGRTGLPQNAVFCPDCRTRLMVDKKLIEDVSANARQSSVNNSSNTKPSTNHNSTPVKDKESSFSNVIGGIIFIALIIGIVFALNTCESTESTGDAVIEEEVVEEAVALDSTVAYADNTASFLSVSNDNVSFSSDGGSMDITISTDGSWEISTQTESWGHISCQDGSLTLTIDANSTGSTRTDYFVVKAGSYEMRINITQSASTKPSATIESVWVEHNVIVNGLSGMNIHTKFSVANQKDKDVYVYAFFYYVDNVTVLHDPYGNDLSIYKNVSPTYDNSTYNDLVLFMPYVSLNLPVGSNGTLSFDICIRDESGEKLARKNNTQFNVIIGG